MAANTDILREGLETGLTAPRIVAERTVAQLERLLAIPIDEAIVPSMAQVASDADRERVREVVRDVVYPADAAFLDALRGDYLAGDPRRARACGRRPSGDALYRTQIRAWTTLDLDPQEVHEIGMEELGGDRGRPARDRPRRPASATTRRRIARRSPPIPANTPGRRRTSCSPGRARTSSGRWRSRRASSGRCRRPAAT